jgi:hypothetical protein
MQIKSIGIDLGKTTFPRAFLVGSRKVYSVRREADVVMTSVISEVQID